MEKNVTKPPRISRETLVLRSVSRKVLSKNDDCAGCLTGAAPFGLLTYLMLSFLPSNPRMSPNIETT